MMRRDARAAKQYDNEILLQFTMLQRGRDRLIYLNGIEHAGKRRPVMMNDGDRNVHGWIRSDRP